MNRDHREIWVMFAMGCLARSGVITAAREADRMLEEYAKRFEQPDVPTVESQPVAVTGPGPSGEPY